MKIRKFDTSKKILIIAEIGVNHEGCLNMAKKLIVKAAESGVDAVKFQTYRASEYVACSDKERFARAKRFQLNYAQFKTLSFLAHKKELLFISTPFDFKSVEAIKNIVDAYKVASCDFTNHALIKYILSMGKPVILSSGMASVNEADGTMSFVKGNTDNRFYTDRVALLHCVACYPAPIDEANLNTVRYLGDRYSVTSGYSDHTKGSFACQIAAASGARIIEKHFTYRKENQVFRDHALSADPSDMKELVAKIRKIEVILGGYFKTPAKCEKGNIVAMRRGLGSRNRIRKGSVLKRSDITFLRPETGIPASRYEAVLGKRAVRDIEKGEVITTEDIA